MQITQQVLSICLTTTTTTTARNRYKVSASNWGHNIKELQMWINKNRKTIYEADTEQTNKQAYKQAYK